MNIEISIQPCKACQETKDIPDRLFSKHWPKAHSRLVISSERTLLFSLSRASRATIGIEGGQMEDCTSLTHRDWRS
jgi:hypothetical protein